MAALICKDASSSMPPDQQTNHNDENFSQRHHAKPFEPVAIIGMAMRLPGLVKSEKDLWDLLSTKKSGLCSVPQDRFNIRGFHDPSGNAGTLPVNQGYFLQGQDIQQFDTTVFQISKKELERLDPSQRHLLQVAYECFESAGISEWRGTNVGCYVGEFGEDWADVNAKETQHRGGYRSTGFGDFAMSNRISYEFDLHGPSMTVKTACSSSLVGLDLACAAIHNGQCESALVGGVSLMFSPTSWLGLNDMGLLSPRGQCRTFDAGADGYARGEAVNMILVKKLSDALRDNDPIRAVIRGTGVNSDGRTNGMPIPSPSAQAALIRRTYAAAGIQDLSDTAIVECHGTGTPVGDPLEVEAVVDCFGDQGVVITSVKPNVGHSEGAAGLTSLIKNVLVLEHRTVLPNINFETPNPDIPFDKYKLHVPTELQEWPSGRAERVSVNSFGIGGVNAHVIIESARQFGVASQVNCHDVAGPKGSAANGVLTNGEHKAPTACQKFTSDLLLFSAYSIESLHGQIDAYMKYAQDQDHADLHDVAYTLANRREHRPHRAFAVTSDDVANLEVSQPQMVKDVSVKASSRSVKVIWAFTGQGAQWPEMGADLLETNAVFQKTIERLDKFLLTLAEPPSWTIEHELRRKAHDSRVHRADFGHPLCVALQVALVDVLRSWGVIPDVIVGHSSGEVAAAYAAGAISAEAAMGIATHRGTSNVLTDRKGSMAAIGLGRADVLQYLVLGVDIACENSQSSTTLSGDEDAVKNVVQAIKADHPGVLARLLRVEKAYHSHHMLEYGASYEQEIKRYVDSRDPTTPMHSCVTGKRLVGDGCLDAHYWRSNMESPVLFNTAFRSAMSDPVLGSGSNVTLIEIGPHPALAGPIGQILRDTGRASHTTHLGTITRGKPCHESLANLAGKLYLQGVPLNYSVLCPPGKFIKNLPSYNWKQDTTHWAESRISREWRFRENPVHELLGSRVFETAASEPTWRKVLALEDVPWLAGHEVNGQVVFPAAGYIAMVGEALQQLREATDDRHETTFSIKNVRIASARVLEMDSTVELITHFKSILLDASEATAWYQFTISSYDGTRWTTNCLGEARASKDKSWMLPHQVPLCSAALPRAVDHGAWYNRLKRIGFNYTGLFDGMQAISAATTATEAKATVGMKRPSSNSRCSRYVLHPSVVDQCFQLFTVASFRGMVRNMSQLSVPVFIEEMVLCPPRTSDALDVTAHVDNTLDRGSFTGNLVAQSRAGEERICISLKGFKTSTLSSSNDGDEEIVPLITQIEWEPHGDFADLNNYFRRRASRIKEWPLLEELTLLCMLDHGDSIKANPSTSEHLVKFSTWMQQQIQRYKQGANKFVSRDLRVESKTASQRLERVAEIVATLSSSPYAVFATAIHRLFSAAPAIFNGEVHPLHILMEDNVLFDFYEAESMDSTNLVRLLANTNPNMRILEVGAGTGGTTAQILQALTSPYGERLYSTYTYTDVSAGFFTAAKQRFANHSAFEYAVLDVSLDPVEQGFELGSYDLIIAANVIHATSNLNTSLRNMHSLLSPRGRLFLEELNPVFTDGNMYLLTAIDALFINYVMGFLPGWWLGAGDNRADQPFISPERWSEELLHAGFSEPESIVLDDSAPYQINAGIVVPRQKKKTSLSRVTLLCHAPDGPYVSEVRHSLEASNVAVDICCLGQELPPQVDVISVLDLQDPVLHGISERAFEIVKGYLTSHKASILWMTPALQVGDTRDPRAAMSLGLARTARNELSLRFFTVEVDEATTEATTAASAAARILHRARAEKPGTHESMDPDYEYAIVEEEILVSRVHWQTSSEALLQSDQPGDKNRTDDSTAAPWGITMRMPGLLHTMAWDQASSSRLPGEGEVLVESRAVGLNFRDVLIALGVVENSPSDMGFEGSGVIRATGPGVSRFSVGDRVMHLGTGCFNTTHVVGEALCVKMGDSMTFEEAAAVPLVYATALMALVDKANLQQGQSVLIHAACGGVGLAAVQIAQTLGAKIYCTVGSGAKRDYLMENYKIPPTHIFNSRDSSFLPGLIHATGGKGVDVVLNSLSGDLLHASWQCVAEHGIMVEIGKRDFQRRGMLAMAPFEANRSFVGVELRLLQESHPERAGSLLKRCVEWIRQGRIRGPAISKTFKAVQIQEALRTMQTARHIGKMIVQMPHNVEELGQSRGKPRHQAPVFPFRSDRTYLLVGGLGGLGRAIATWMVENGARSLVFLSRSARQGPGTDGFMQELHSQGCQGLLVNGSVNNMADAQRAVNNKVTAVRPLAGVMNLSMVLRDAGLANMTFDDWQTAVEPKVRGTWNLHEATSSVKTALDFFLLFSSFSGIVGQQGQANYAAANAFLDAFVRFRQRQGLVASVIDLGVMGEVGFVSQNQSVLNNFGRMGMRILSERNLLDALVLALRRSQPCQAAAGKAGIANRNIGQVGLGLSSTVSVSSPLNRAPFWRDARLSIYRNLESSWTTSADSRKHSNRASSQQASLRTKLAPVMSEEDKTTAIAEALAAELAMLLIKDQGSIPLDQPLSHLGMDSLVAMEMRNWIRQQVKVETSTISIVQSPSMRHLAEQIKKALQA